MNKIRTVILVAAILLVMTAGASAYPIPQEHRAEVKDDITAWKVAEEHIGDSWARDTLRQLGQQYTNHGVDVPSGHGLAQLRAKMSYYAQMKGIALPVMQVIP